MDAEALSDDEFEALAEHISRADDALADLERLRALTGDRKRRIKALKRVVFRLGQRGIDTKSLALDEAPKGIRIAPEAEAGGGLPVLMAPIDINATRRVSFALPSGPDLKVVEAMFKSRSLFRLLAAPSDRREYRQWAKRMCRAGADDSLPERVRVPASWLDRKLWEVGRYLRQGDLGPEVDKDLAATLSLPKARPDHPARELDLEGSRRLTMAELAERPERLHPFYHGSAMAALRQQWYEVGSDEYVESSGPLQQERHERMQRAVFDWANQWGFDRIAEVLLDAALFFGVRGDRDAARTFLDIVSAPTERERDAQIRDFLFDYAIWQLTR